MDMTEVIIAGIGQTEVGEHWEISLRSLTLKAIQAAIQDAAGLKPQILIVGNMLAANLSRQAHLGALLADFSGMTGIEASAVEAGGASGGAAIRQGYLAVASGLVDVALVVGVEKFTDVVGPGVESALTTLADSDFEASQGVTPASQAALLMQRYIHEFEVPVDGLAGFAINAHANAVANPYAMYRKAISADAYRKAETISEPVNMLDMAPNADGAAALILTRRELLLPNYPHPLVRIASSSSAADTIAIHDRMDPLWFSAAQISVVQALRKAGLTREQIDFFEYHDAFTIFAALALEAAGYAKRGEGWKLGTGDIIGLKGSIPCATLGGLKARGYPGGATGVYQAVEATIQLRGQAGVNQVSGAQLGMVQSLGGPASVAVTHILQRLEAEDKT